MSEILFIRHAETDMTGTFCGHSNPPLNTRGRSQLSEILHTIRSESICEVYASDLLRTRQTGDAIAAGRAIECQLRPALREINFGQWEGLTWKEITQRNSAHAQRWLADYPSLPAPGGERICDFERRVLVEVKSLAMRATGESVVAVVTHGGVLRTILCRLCGYSEAEAWERTKAYCSIFRYKISTSLLMQSMEVGS
jgi:alpha-ribazole phosphatase